MYDEYKNSYCCSSPNGTCINRNTIDDHNACIFDDNIGPLRELIDQHRRAIAECVRTQDLIPDERANILFNCINSVIQTSEQAVELSRQLGEGYKAFELFEGYYQFD